jgi:hypothetical protein
MTIYYAYKQAWVSSMTAKNKTPIVTAPPDGYYELRNDHPQVSLVFAEVFKAS